MKTLEKHLVIMGLLFSAFALLAGPPPRDESDKKTVRIVSMTVQPSEVSLNKHSLHVRIKIEEGLGRKGSILIRQTDLNHAAAIAQKQLDFNGGQRIVEGDLDIVCYKTGSATLLAKVENRYESDSSYEVKIKIVEKE
jgi:hypothetical protein